LGAWLKLCRELWDEDYSEVVDLHSSLRTKILKLYFRFRSLTGTPMPKWRTIEKSRWRLYGYFIFKKAWPRHWRPRPMIERFSFVAGGDGSERPKLDYLKSVENPVAVTGAYLCVMPGSAWPGKRWPVRNYVQVLRAAGIPAVVLGSQGDAESAELVRHLEREALPFVSGVGKWDLLQNAKVLSDSLGYLGNDTGMAHLAQALGVPATVVLGPTVQDMGFGPWQAGSASVSASLWCSPCGKDGRFCFRLTNRYACMSQLKPETVAEFARRSP
jgi:ADP-heptose:LPS heptosyltransferase